MQSERRIIKANPIIDLKILIHNFSGYTFRPRHAKNKYGKFFTNFLPAIGENAKKAIHKIAARWLTNIIVNSCSIN